MSKYILYKINGSVIYFTFSQPFLIFENNIDDLIDNYLKIYNKIKTNNIFEYRKYINKNFLKYITEKNIFFYSFNHLFIEIDGNIYIVYKENTPLNITKINKVNKVNKTICNLLNLKK